MGQFPGDGFRYVGFGTAELAGHFSRSEDIERVALVHFHVSVHETSMSQAAAATARYSIYIGTIPPDEEISGQTISGSLVRGIRQMAINQSDTETVVVPLLNEPRGPHQM